MTGECLLAVDALRAGYGGDPALEGVGFRALAGEIVAVLGPNGGGKTTLFRALLDELPERSGTVELHGRAAYVPQTERSRLDFPVSALDVALMGTYASTPWYRRIGPRERAVASEALQRVGMGESRTEPYGSLSGGQRQRVLIARALAQDAEVLLLDEPFTAIDRPGADRLLELLAALRGDGRALLVATHDIQQARGFDRVLCLNRRQLGFGPPAETLDAETLERTYGEEIVVLEVGRRVLSLQHHAHL